MKRRLGYLLTVILAMTMVMGIGVTALAATVQYTIDESTSDFSDVFEVSGNPFVKIDNNMTSNKVYLTFQTNSKTEEVEPGTHPNYYCSGAGVSAGDRVQVKYTQATHSLVISFYQDTPAPAENCGAHTHNFQWQTITEPTQYSDGLAGDVCTICGFAKNTQPLSAYGFAINDYATKMVNASKSGQVIKLELGEWNSFPKAFMEKVAAKSAQNVTFVFKYKWNHVKQEITIPAGTLVDTSLDWYGPAKMAELYGAN